MSRDVAAAAGRGAGGATSSLPHSPVDSRFTPRRPRRQTESAVYQAIHAPAHPSVRSSQVTDSHSGVKAFSTTRRRPGTAQGQPRQTMFVADDPRDTGRASALRADWNNSGYAEYAELPANNPTITTTSSSSTPSAPPSSLHHPHPHPSSHQPLPRLPQSRFSFEYQYPLRKRALTSQTNASSANDSTASSVPDPTPTPQRTTLLYDRHRRSVPSFNLSHPRTPTASASSSQPQSPQFAIEDDSDSAPPLDAAGSTVRVLSPNATKRRKASFYAHQTPPDVKRRMPSSTVSYVQGRTLADDRDRDRAVNGFDKHAPEDGNRTPIADDSRSKGDDIFLNIARSDSTRRESLGRSELRRSRFRMSGQGLRSPASRANEQTPSPDQVRLNTYDNPLHSNNGSPSTPHSSLAYQYSASAHPLDDHSRSHHSGYVSSSRTTLGLPRSRLSHAGPDASPQYPESSLERRGSLQNSPGYRHSSLSTIRSSRQTSASEATERARLETEGSRQDGTESTLSTTAPSTVWDELEDLKSRIKKLELTGKLPPSSQEAITSAAERPRTATTTITTASSSPKHGRKTSNPSAASDTITVPNPVHPLLQSAMANAKDVLSNEVYMALEATMTDALSLSNILGSNKAPSNGASVVSGYGSSDRLSKRKADSVCRSLTELCLALSDEELRRQQPPAIEAPPQQSNSPEEGTLTPTLSFQRSIGQEPEGLVRRQSTNRVTSRLEARRASFANTNGSPLADNNNNNTNRNDSALEPSQAKSPGTSVPMSRLNRLSTSLRMRRVQTEDENTPHDGPHGRSISRSMTIGNPVSTPRVAPRQQRMSYGYTASQAADHQQDQSPRVSTQPLQSQLPQPRTPTASQSGIPLRRSLMTPTSSYTPTTSRSNIQAGSRRYGLSSANNEGAYDDASNSQQEPPHTRIVAPSTKIAASYTPISQNRMRTNSLGARRFGIRHRPMSTSDGALNSLDDSID